MAALGLLEVCGYSTALLAINTMYLNADIRVLAIDFNKPAVADLDKIPLQVQIKFTGSVSQVEWAMACGVETANKYNEEDEIIAHVIANAHEGMSKLASDWG